MFRIKIRLIIQVKNKLWHRYTFLTSNGILHTLPLICHLFFNSLCPYASVCSPSSSIYLLSSKAHIHSLFTFTVLTLCFFWLDGTKFRHYGFLAVPQNINEMTVAYMFLNIVFLHPFDLFLIFRHSSRNIQTIIFSTQPDKLIRW